MTFQSHDCQDWSGSMLVGEDSWRHYDGRIGGTDNNMKHLESQCLFNLWSTRPLEACSLVSWRVNDGEPVTWMVLATFLIAIYNLRGSDSILPQRSAWNATAEVHFRSLVAGCLPAQRLSLMAWLRRNWSENQTFTIESCCRGPLVTLDPCHGSMDQHLPTFAGSDRMVTRRRGTMITAP